MYKILNNINSPKDLKSLNYKELYALSSEIRNYIIEIISENGGHLSSNLGTVELTIALHRIFNSPTDKIIWDVGHQCYIHKIITGRKEAFKSIRRYKGISGFPKTSESEHDIFNTGHSSTSISAALGLAKTRDLHGEDYSVVAVIGDGSLGSGIALEALNNAAELKTNLIVVLNDNKMSISKNVGSLSSYLGRLRTGKFYFKVKKDLEYFLNKIPLLGKGLYKAASKFRDWFKYLIVKGIVFEELGFKYLGPIDGHSIESLEKILESAKSYKKHPVIIHVVTKKGNGFTAAEQKPDKYHGVGPFCIETGEEKSNGNRKSYSTIFGNKLIDLAENNDKILAITAAMLDGTELKKFAEKFKNRFFDVGIAEQHAVTFCAGLAAGGFRPIFAVYSTFLQRAYDQVLHDVCLQNLPVIFSIDRAGIVGSDGETHQGLFDISYLRSMPNIVIMSPKSGIELENMLELAFTLDTPVAIRYPRGEAAKFELIEKPVYLGKGELLTTGKDAVIIAEGSMVKTATSVYELLKKRGYDLTIANARFLKPLDSELLDYIFDLRIPVYTVEDNVLYGGFGSSVLEYCSLKNKYANVKIFAHKNGVLEHGDKQSLLKLAEIDANTIAETIYNDLLREVYEEK